MSREYQSSGIGAHSGPGAAPQPQILSASLPLCVKNILRYPSTCANRNGLLRKRLLPGWRGLAGAPGKANLPIQTPCLRGSAHSVFERRRPMRCHVAVRNRISAHSIQTEPARPSTRPSSRRSSRSSESRRKSWVTASRYCGIQRPGHGFLSCTVRSSPCSAFFRFIPFWISANEFFDPANKFLSFLRILPAIKLRQMILKVYTV